MKNQIIKPFVALILICSCIFSQAQTSDSVFVKHYKDKMTDKEYLLPSRTILLISPSDNTKGVKLMPLSMNKNGDFELYTKSFRIGTCSEHDNIIILFANGSKIKSKSWKDFDCKGVSYFKLSDKDKILLETEEIISFYIGIR